MPQAENQVEELVLGNFNNQQPTTVHHDPIQSEPYDFETLILYAIMARPNSSIKNFVALAKTWATDFE
jgi:hypothetical protein